MKGTHAFAESIRFERTIIHKKRIAPKGYCFFVVTAKDKDKIYSMYQLVRTEGMSDEREQELKDELISEFKKHFHL